MGYYVNTPEGKEAFLRENAIRLSGAPDKYADIPETDAVVCLVNNGMFNAAGVVYCQSELEAFNDNGDSRPKEWYQIAREKLYPVSDITAGCFA